MGLLIFVIGVSSSLRRENKKVLGLKREGYAYFDQAIDLIKDVYKRQLVHTARQAMGAGGT